MAGLDEIIHQPLRLRIMAALNALPSGTGLEFARLKQLTGATDGNLGTPARLTGANAAVVTGAVIDLGKASYHSLGGPGLPWPRSMPSTCASKVRKSRIATG